MVLRVGEQEPITQTTPDGAPVLHLSPPHRPHTHATTRTQVRTALGSKVSRERIGAELEGMFNGGRRGRAHPSSCAASRPATLPFVPPGVRPPPAQQPPSPARPSARPAGKAPEVAMQLLHQLRLFPQVFTPHPSTAPLLADDVGEPCCSSITAAQQLLAGQAWQVRLGCRAAGGRLRPASPHRAALHTVSAARRHPAPQPRRSRTRSSGACFCWPRCCCRCGS
jgi:hypothetical protein